MRSTRILIASLASLAVIACSSARRESKAEAPKGFPDVPNMTDRRWANALEKAAKELGCPASQVAYESPGSGRFVFTGAGKATEYALYCVGWSCVWLDDVRVRAAFDLNCPREQLQLTYINENTRGVAGCDHRATYVAHVAQNFEVTWILNSGTGQ